MVRRRKGSESDLTTVATSTIDGVRLGGVHLPGRNGVSELAYVVCHGMTNATAKPSTRAVLEAFSNHGSVFAFDFRGHGLSGGRSTVGRDEVRDVDAAIGFARRAGFRRVALVGFSMGAAVSLRQAGTAQRDPMLSHQADAVVSVSAPSRWFLRETRFMLRVQWLLEHPVGPLIAHRLGIRLAKPWSEVPSTPLQDVSAIAPVPLLIVHGTNDHYFDPREAIALHRAAPGSELWLIPKMGHAESGISPDTIDRVANWVSNQLN